MKHQGSTRRAAALAVLLAAAAGGCASAGSDRLVPGPARAGTELAAAEIDAIAEVLMLEDHRRFDRDAFERLAYAESIEVRRRAVTAAGRIGDPAASPLLLDVLARDPAPQVRADAAFALGELGDTTAAVVDALGDAALPSWVPVREAEVDEVVEILGALGKLGTADAARLVGDALLETRTGLNETARRIAAEALLAAWRFGSNTPTARIAPYLDAPDPDLRWRAAYALMRSARPAGVPYLLGRGQAEEHRVRAYAARALVRERAEEAGVADSARGILDGLLEDEHPHVRINAAGALASWGEAAPVERIAALLGDEDPNVAIAAASALGRVGAPAAPRLAAAAADPELPLPVRGAALAHLAPLDRPRAAFITEGMSRGGFHARYLAARALAPLGPEAAGPLVATLAEDEDARVAIAALEAAGAFAADTALSPGARRDARRLLLRTLEHEDPWVAAVAAAALAPAAGSEDVPDLLAAYERFAAAGSPAERAAALAVVETLGAVEGREGGAAAAFFGRAGRSPDRWIARTVADTLGGGWGTPPTAVAAEGPAFYSDIVRRYVAGPLAGEDRPVAEVRTRAGTFEIELISEEAPLTVANFVDLAEAGYYDAGVWHRVVPNFVLQDGAPAGWPSGGPGWAIRDEINRLRYGRGAVGMALAGPDTGGSQWFVTHSPQPHLDGGYTIFGRVDEDGMGVADAVVQGDEILSIRIR